MKKSMIIAVSMFLALCAAGANAASSKGDANRVILQDSAHVESDIFHKR